VAQPFTRSTKGVEVSGVEVSIHYKHGDTGVYGGKAKLAVSLLMEPFAKCVGRYINGESNRYRWLRDEKFRVTLMGFKSCMSSNGATSGKSVSGSGVVVCSANDTVKVFRSRSER
jgi:hypothetical protein